MAMYGLGFGMFNVVLWLFLIAAWIYSFVLFVKLARSGIRALDIYIGKNQEL
jgi:hypothetical protein